MGRSGDELFEPVLPHPRHEKIINDRLGQSSRPDCILALAVHLVWVGKKKAKRGLFFRSRERDMKQLARDRERLAFLSAGGAPDRPIEVDSAAIVEMRAESFDCTQCGGRNRTDAHEAKRFEGRVLRRVQVKCVRCGNTRALWFRVVGRAIN